MVCRIERGGPKRARLCPLPTTRASPLERTPLARTRGCAPLARASASHTAGWRNYALAARVPLNLSRYRESPPR